MTRSLRHKGPHESKPTPLDPQFPDPDMKQLCLLCLKK